MRQLIHHHHARFPGQDGLEIHLVQLDVPVPHLPWRQNLERSHLGFGRGPTVGLHETDHDVHPPRPERVRLLEHPVGLPDPGGGSHVHLHAPPLAPGEPIDRAIELFVDSDRTALPVLAVGPEPVLLGIVRRSDVSAAYLRRMHGARAADRPD